jgi:hypothetical protein
MKKLMTLSFIAATILVACSKKAVPTTGATTTSGKTETVKTEVAQPSEKSKADIEAKQKIEATEKTPATPASPASPVMTEMDNGKSLFITKCTSCHAAKNTSDFTFSQWQGILRSMVPKAKLSSDEEKQLTAYIKANAKQ